MLLPQDAEDVLIRLPGMDDQWQVGGAGSPDVPAKALLLRLARGLVIEVVEARLADADDPRMVGERHDCLDRGQPVPLAGIVRVDTDRAPDIRETLGERLDLRGLTDPCADGDQAADPGLPGARDDALDLLVVE